MAILPGKWILSVDKESDESLEATILREGTAESLPVFTLPIPDRVFHSSAFLERVVQKLFDHLLYADNLRGSGRLFIP
ncbi:MAG: hypothetical protein EXS16_06135 [Gemmataceae bacterium]|nr:hypothetical protein [Gemmataceae bacterium]